MSVEISGKTVLLIAPSFFGYAAEIERTLTRWGARVLNYENRPLTSLWGKAMVRMAPRLLSPVSDRYFLDIFERHQDEEIDFLFVIRGEALSPRVMQKFSQLFPSAQKILYLWDSFLNDPLAPTRVDHFDIASTFDPDDAESDRRLRFVPLFYLTQFGDLREQTIEYDLCFIGTAHSDRYPILRELRESLAGKYKIFYFLYLQSEFMYWASHLLNPSFWRASKEEFSFLPLKRADVLNAFGGSRAILDIERSIQTGLTMRSLETLGAQRKLVTTNDTIRRYDFYDENNIAIIERNKPRLPSGFLEAPFKPTPATLLEKYSVEQWLLIVLGLRNTPTYLRLS